MNVESTLTHEQRVWLREKLHPSCRYVVRNNFLTDYYYDVVRALGDHDGRVYSTTYGGQGTVIIAKRESVNSPVMVIMLDYDDNYKHNFSKFTNGYRRPY